MKARTFDNRETAKGLVFRPEFKKRVERNRKRDYTRKGKGKFRYTG